VRVIENQGIQRRIAGVIALGLVFVVEASPAGGQQVSNSPPAPLPVPAALTATSRPGLPTDISQIWMVPDRTAPSAQSRQLAGFVAGMRLFAQGQYAQALPPLTSSSAAATPVAAYAAFHAGLSHLNLSHVAEARAIFARLHAGQVAGYLSEAAILREAEAASLLGDHAAALRLYQELRGRKTGTPDAVLMALAREQQAVGDRAQALESLAQLYYEFPLSDVAAAAASELDNLNDLRSPRESPARFKLDIGRAERLFGFRRYQEARDAFDLLRPIAGGDDAELVGLRLAECDYYLRRHQQARDQLGPYLEKASRKAEARFFHLTATRELGDHDEYVRLARDLVAAFPTSTWAEETLNNLATHFIVTDDNAQAEAAFRELYQKFPQGPHAERAAWRAGWWAYRGGRYAEAVMYFESAAGSFPRSDYRPSYLYWSGRARGQMGDSHGAAALYRIVATDYLNTYYGRLAAKRLQGAGVQQASGGAGQAAAGAPLLTATPPTSEVIRTLLALGLYDEARNELFYALRTWGESPSVNATLGWVCNQQRDMRRGIIYMKRAYPQYMSSEGSRLPADALRVVFPLDYWPLIKKHSAAHDLDPYLVAALINQESAFDASVKSSANAIGLMQLLPSVGREYARKLRIRRYSTSALTRPDVNIQLGTAHFADLIRRLNGVHNALASYNAGERRVAQWRVDRQDLETDEYIDDIPYPETQGYVRRILGTAEDYRRLYEGWTGVSTFPAAARKAKAPSANTSKKR
jgi:soluble lytic murein transglycosylase